MAKVQQRFLIAAFFAALIAAPPAWARKFYPDDPLREVPPPRRVENPYKRKLNDYYDFFLNTFFQPWEKHTPGHIISAGGVNTLDEVPDSSWYTNRHGSKRMSIEDLRRGPGVDNPPSAEKPWKVVDAKTEGITPGFTMEDAKGRRYLVKVDPKDYPELATAADVIGSKFLHALGYYVPENYIIHFKRGELAIGQTAKITDRSGKERMMKSRDLDEILLGVPRDGGGTYRGVASYFISGKLLGPFRFHGVRKDDPNDVVSHEHRRDLRGLYVFSSWLGHNDIKSLNTLDSLVQEGPLQYIRHYLIDFGAALGSDSFTAKSPRAGYEYLFAWAPSAAEMFTLGLHVPDWARADYPKIRGVGRFEWKVFDPEEWKPNYPNPAFDNRLPDDTYWAAKQVMRFTDEEIRAMVETGELTDPKAIDWLTRALIERRDKIGRAFLAKVLPLENFRITTVEGSGGKLEFDDLEVKYGLHAPRQYSLQWSSFDNQTEGMAALRQEHGYNLPAEFQASPSGAYYAVQISAADNAKRVTAYFRKTPRGAELVGVERAWSSTSGGDRLSYLFEDSDRNQASRDAWASHGSQP